MILVSKSSHVNCCVPETKNFGGQLADKKSNKPRITFYDLETSLQTAAIFQLAHNDYINPDSLLTERYIICGSWKLEGESKVHTVSVLDDPKRFKKDPQDDYYVVKKLHEVMSEATTVCAHNGDGFDNRFLATRILYHGLPALPPINSIDTLKVARNKFMFNSNKLDYLGKFLKVGKKLATTPGLWMRILHGDIDAINHMIKYNQEDVRLLERVYQKLKPFIPNAVNLELYGVEGCPKCGSDNCQSRGLHRAISRVYRRFMCSDCGSWFRSAINEKDVKPTKRIL